MPLSSNFQKLHLPKYHQISCKIKTIQANLLLRDIKQVSQKVSFKQWEKEFVKMLNKDAPFKTRVIWGNRKLFITKNLRKPIMKRSALQKRPNIPNNQKIIKLYKKHKL